MRIKLAQYADGMLLLLFLNKPKQFIFSTIKEVDTSGKKIGTLKLITFLIIAAFVVLAAYWKNARYASCTEWFN